MYLALPPPLDVRQGPRADAQEETEVGPESCLCSSGGEDTAQVAPGEPKAWQPPLTFLGPNLDVLFWQKMSLISVTYRYSLR